MDTSYLKMWVRSIITEEINKDQLKSVSDALHIPITRLRSWVENIDPTPNKSFSVWLLRGLKKEWIRMEDANRITPLLQRFIQLRNASRIEDIMTFPHINDLENRIDQLTGQGSNRQGFAQINPLELPGVSLYTEHPEQGITYYKVTDPKSLGKLGEGTKWCTRLSYDREDPQSMAKRYLNEYKFLIVGFKEGKPYIQFNPDYSQVMDVNDVSFRGRNSKSLELPPPEILKNPLQLPKPTKVKYIRPVQPKRSHISLTQNQLGLKNWMTDYTNTPIDPNWEKYVISRGARTNSTKGRDFNYEQRWVNSILKTHNHENFAAMMEGFWEYASEEISGERAPVMENGLLTKNFSDVKKSYGKGRNGKREKRAYIPGLYYIAQYVVNNIKGNWPEFEKKIQDDPYNSISYYKITNLNPDNVTNPLTKDLVLFARMIKEGNITVPKQEFNNALKDFFLRVRPQWKFSSFNPVVHNVLLPYLKMTNQKLQDVLGNKTSQLLRKSYELGKKSKFWKQSDK